MLSFIIVALSAACHTPSRTVCKSIKQELKAMLLLKVFLTDHSETEYLVCILCHVLKPACSSAINSSAWGFGRFSVILKMTVPVLVMRTIAHTITP